MLQCLLKTLTLITQLIPHPLPLVHLVLLDHQPQLNQMMEVLLQCLLPRPLQRHLPHPNQMMKTYLLLPDHLPHPNLMMNPHHPFLHLHLVQLDPLVMEYLLNLMTLHLLSRTLILLHLAQVAM